MKTCSGIKLSKLEKWSNFEDDILKRMGAVKTDGFYANAVYQYFDSALVDCLNSGNPECFRDDIDDKATFQVFKGLVNDLRSKGSIFTLIDSKYLQEVNYEDIENSYIGRRQLVLGYVKNKQNKQLKLLFTLVVNEYSVNKEIVFSGYAKLVRVDDVRI